MNLFCFDKILFRVCYVDLGIIIGLVYFEIGENIEVCMF